MLKVVSPLVQSPVTRLSLLDPQAQPVQVGMATTSYSDVTITNTVRRPFPWGVPLVTQATSRSVEERRFSSDLGTRISGQTLTSGPASHFYAAGPRLGLTPPLDPDFIALDARLREKIKRESANVLVTLAERKQTLGLVSSAVTGILSFYRTVRDKKTWQALVSQRKSRLPSDWRFRPRRERLALLRSKDGIVDSRTRDLADAWLQYSFGMVPLMSDIYGTVDEINKSMNEGMLYWVKTRKETLDTSSGSYRDNDMDIFCSHEQSMQARARASYVIKSKVMNRLTALGITNPASFAWELIPYSFVVDWIIPVGDFLSSLDALAGVEDVTVYRGYRHERVYKSLGPFGEVKWEFVAKTRYLPNSTLALPRLSFDNKFKLKQLAHSVALLRQIL